MLNEEKKQLLLEQFSTYLNSTPENSDTESNSPEVDLYQLFTELAALKSEVKIESRQVKSAIGDFRALTDLLQKNNEQLNQELVEHRQQESENLEKIELPFLLALIDLHDRIDGGIVQAKKFNPGWFGKRDENTLRHIRSLHEGMEISLRRLNGLLERYKVLPINAVDKPLDPHTMQVSGTEQQPDKVNGVVLMETRKGYMRNGELLRLAEVTVNKNPLAHTGPN